MKIMKLAGTVTVIATIAFFASCGSSSSSSDSGTTTAGENSVAVSDLSTLPSLDFDSVDATSANLAAQPALAKSLADGESQEGSTSKAGCMAVNYLKPTAFSQLKQVEMFKCYVSTTQDNKPELTIPTGSYGYYLLDQGASAAIRYIRARIGNFVSDSTSTFKMEACESLDNSTYSKIMELELTGDKSAKTWNGFATSHFQVSQGQQSISKVQGEDEAVTGGFSNSTFLITMSSAAALEEDFDFANVSAIDTTSTFGRNPNPADSDATASTTYKDGFSVDFDYEASSSVTNTLLNIVRGRFAESTGVARGIFYAKFNSSQGAAYMSYDSSTDSNDFTSNEAFSITEVAGSDPTITVVDETNATYSALYDNVVAAVADIGSTFLTVPDDVTAVVAYTTGWDCTAPEGTSFTSIDASAISYSACDDLQNEISDGNSKGSASCFEGGGQQLACSADSLCSDFNEQAGDCATCLNLEAEPALACLIALCDGEQICIDGVQTQCNQ